RRSCIPSSREFASPPTSTPRSTKSTYSLTRCWKRRRREFRLAKMRRRTFVQRTVLGAADVAQRAIYRYSKWPTQAITYNLGKNAIADLRDAHRSKKGNVYSAKDFHERFMRMGTIPAGFIRDVLLSG